MHPQLTPSDVDLLRSLLLSRALRLLSKFWPRNGFALPARVVKIPFLFLEVLLVLLRVPAWLLKVFVAQSRRLGLD